MFNRILVLCLILLAASALIAHESKPEIVPILEPLSGIPMQIGEWRGVKASDFDNQILDVLGVDDYVNRVYYSPERVPVGLYIGYYQSQRQGDTIHSPMNCLPGAGWNPVKTDRIVVPVNDGSIKINKIIILKGTNKQLVLYWYQSHGRVVASEYWGKIYTVLDAIRTNRTDAAMVRAVCPLQSLDPEAEAAAEKITVDFITALYPLLGSYLPS
jgi:EpsI family protein